MYLITGSTGNVGRELVKILVAKGASVRALTRNASTCGHPTGTEVVDFDTKKNSHEIHKVFDGVSAAFLNPAAISEPDDFLRCAKQAGVKKIVLLSALPVRDDLPLEQQPGFIARRHKYLEQRIEASGLHWVHLRSNMLMSNAFFEVLPQIRRGDLYQGAYPDAVEVPVDERDVAAVAAAVLLEDGHTGNCYQLTGPEAVTHLQKVEIIAQAIGREIQFKELTREQAKAQLIASFPVQHSNGLSDDHIETVFNYAQESIGRSPLITDTIKTILRRAPGTYSTWAKDHHMRFK